MHQTSSHQRCKALLLGSLATILAFTSGPAHAQAARLLWDQDLTSGVTGFAVLVDGIRADYGLTPLADGSCGCSIPLPFSSGRHTIVVVAYNSAGETPSAPLVVGPTAHAGGPYTGEAGISLTVSGASSTDSTGTITAYSWNWGDGTSDTTSSSPTASHSYASPGTFTITLTVTDDFPWSESATTTATIGAPPPPPGMPAWPTPADGDATIGTTPTLTWSATGADTYDVQLGTSAPPPQVAASQASASYSPPGLSWGTTYYWQITARNIVGVAVGPIWSFTTTPAPPEVPTSPNPADGATNASTTPTLTWTATGADTYDLRFGTANPPPQVATGQISASYSPPTLSAGTTYFWQVTAQNAGGATEGSIWSFTTANTSSSATEIVIYASDLMPSDLHGRWTTTADSTSPNGMKLLRVDNLGVSDPSAPLVTPTDYVEISFSADADVPYTIWLRLQATGNSKWNDSAWVQFSDATVNGSPRYALDSTDALLVNLATSYEATSLNGWGWQNGAYWLAQPTTVAFSTSGTHTLRLQVREDGVQFDQIVLSPVTYLTTPPGPLTNDSTIVPRHVVGPTARAGGPYTGQAGISLTVSGAGSTDSTGTIATYSWNWGDGTSDTTSSSPTASHSYASPGTFTITLTVTDDFPRSGSTTTTASIGAPPQPPGMPASPAPANGATNVSTTPTLTWSATGASTYELQFGSGNPPPQVATGQPNAAYSPPALSPGTTYYWQVTAQNSGGSTGGPVWSFTTTPAPPGAPSAPNPAEGATNVSTTPTLTWSATGATAYDVRFGTANPPPQVATGQTNPSYSPPALSAGTTYYWQVTAQNAGGATEGSIWSFTTETASSSATEIVIYASDLMPSDLHGRWTTAGDSTSPNGMKLLIVDNLGVSDPSAPLVTPTDYVEISFSADADVPYTVWLRLQATGNSKWNDSVWVQFSDATVNGSPRYALDSTEGLLVNLATSHEATSLNGWGWQNGAYWLAQPTTVVFSTSGTHTLRLQVREDGVHCDQIVLSPVNYRTTPPGPVTNDSTIVPR